MDVSIGEIFIFIALKSLIYYDWTFAKVLKIDWIMLFYVVIFLNTYQKSIGLRCSVQMRMLTFGVM